MNPMNPTHKCTVCKNTWISEFADLCPECFQSLEKVRIFSPAGPCLTGYRRVRNNQTTVTVAIANGRHHTIDREPTRRIHTSPCVCCQDSHKSVYPEGRMD